MSQKKRMKMCSNCDGFVDLDVIICPYCGSELSETNITKEEYINQADSSKRKKLSVDETLSSLYPPPYQPKNIYLSDQKEIPEGFDFKENDLQENKNNIDSSSLSSFENQINSNEKNQSFVVDNIEKKEKGFENKKENKKFSIASYLPIVMFSLGVNFLLLGLYLLIFSTNGEIFIRWNASVWYVYFLVSIPFILLGYKKLGVDRK